MKIIVLSLLFIIPAWLYAREQTQDSFVSSTTDSLKEFDRIKPDFMVNELEGTNGADQLNPYIAVDGNGNFAMLWRDSRSGVNKMYTQFYNSKNEKIDSNMLVLENPSEWNNYYITGNPKGGFAVIWNESTGLLAVQKYTTEGKKSGETFMVNSSIIHTNQLISASFNKKGQLIVVWTGVSNNRTTLLYRIFDEQGSAIMNTNTLIDSSGSGNFTRTNCTASDHEGNFVVVWSSYYKDHARIFLQRIKSTGEKDFSNILVSDVVDIRNHFSPQISSTDDGYFLISWEATNNIHAKGGIAARIYNCNGLFVTDQFNIVESNTYYGVLHFSVSYHKENFIVLYKYDKYYYKLIDKDGLFSADGELSITPPDSGYMTVGNISGFGNDIYFSLLHYNYFEYDVYYQRYNQDLTPLTIPIKVNDDLYSSSQYNPVVYFNQFGESILLWLDPRYGFHDLYAQVYDKNMNPVGNNIGLTNRSNTESPAVKSLSDGTFAVVYAGANWNETPGLFIQKVSTSGSLSGSRVQIDEMDTYPLDIKMSINDKDEMFLCWYPDYPIHTIYFRKFDENFNPLSPKKIITTQKNGFTPTGFSLSINKKFNIFTTWINKKYFSYQNERTINGIIFNESGKAITDTLIIKTLNATDTQYETTNFLDDDDNYIVIMNNYNNIYVNRTYNMIHTFENTWPSDQMYFSKTQVVSFTNRKSFITWNYGNIINGAFLDDINRKYDTYIVNFITTSPLYYDSRKEHHSALYEDKLFLTYESDKNGSTGYDIWANVQKTKAMDFEPGLFFPPVDDDVLYNNFPNPFNASTKIVYEILSYHHVKLAIYDILGREVRVLVDQTQEKGLYKVDLNAAGLSSGVYFYRLDAFRTSIKKMLLIK